MLRKTFFLVFLLFCLLGILVGCATTNATPTQQDPDQLFLEAAQTVEAMLTGTAGVKLSVEPTSTATVAAAATATASPTASIMPNAIPPTFPATSAAGNLVTHTPCDVADFVSDVTIPDDTEILGGNAFTKTWELRNSGTCTWNTSYLLVFYSGSLMDGPSTQQLSTDTVAPGETVDISVELTAPDTTGTHTGYWVLRNDSGINFGIGTTGSSFYVKIVVDTVATYTPTSTVTSDYTATPTITPTIQTIATNTPAPTLTTAPSQTPVPSDMAIPSATATFTEAVISGSGS